MRPIGERLRYTIVLDVRTAGCLVHAGVQRRERDLFAGPSRAYAVVTPCELLGFWRRRLVFALALAFDAPPAAYVPLGDVTALAGFASGEAI